MIISIFVKCPSTFTPRPPPSQHLPATWTAMTWRSVWRLILHTYGPDSSLPHYPEEITSTFINLPLLAFTVEWPREQLLSNGSVKVNLWCKWRLCTPSSPYPWRAPHWSAYKRRPLPLQPGLHVNAWWTLGTVNLLVCAGLLSLELMIQGKRG